MKKTLTKQASEPKRICDDCAHGIWNTEFCNLDLHGKPITLRCPLYKEGNVGIIRGTKACDKYQSKL